MKALAVILTIVLVLFTVYQGYLLVKKIQLKKKCKGNSNSDSTSNQIDKENSNKEVEQ